MNLEEANVIVEKYLLVNIQLISGANKIPIGSFIALPDTRGKVRQALFMAIESLIMDPDEIDWEMVEVLKVAYARLHIFQPHALFEEAIRISNLLEKVERVTPALLHERNKLDVILRRMSELEKDYALEIGSYVEGLQFERKLNPPKVEVEDWLNDETKIDKTIAQLERQKERLKGNEPG